MKKYLFLLMIVGLVVYFKQYPVKFESPPIEVNTAEVVEGDVAHIIDAYGVIETAREVEISSQVMGRIKSIPVQDGQAIKRGDLVVELDDADFLAQVESTRASVGRLKTGIELIREDISKSKRDLEQATKLLHTKSVDATTVRDLKTTVNKDEIRLAMSEFELTEAEAALKKVEEDLKNTKIVSPINGVVAKVLAEVGEVAVVGTTNNPGSVLMIISDLDEILVKAHINENDVPFVKKDQKVVVRLQYNDTTLDGVVKTIDIRGIKVDDTANFETIIALHDSPESLRLGMNVTVEIFVEEVHDVVVPTSAVFFRKNTQGQYKQYVYVVDHNKVRLTEVSTGVSDEKYAQVLSGLNLGDNIVIGPYKVLDNLKEGELVLCHQN